MRTKNLFQWTEYTTRDREGYFEKWKWTRVKDLWKLRSIRDKDVYRSIWTWEKPEHDSPKIGDFHIDFDSANLEESQRDAVKILDSLENTYNVDPRSLEIGFTGSKGFFIIIPWPVFLDEPIPEPSTAYKRLGEYFRLSAPTLDLGIYATRRMWRMTNSIHQKTRLHRIELKPRELREKSIPEIKDMARRPRWVNHQQPSLSEPLHKIIDKIQKNTQQGDTVNVRFVYNGTGRFSELPAEKRIPRKHRSNTPEGERHNTITEMIGTLTAAGAPPEEVWEIVRTFNQRYCDPPFTPKELEREIQGLL